MDAQLIGDNLELESKVMSQRTLFKCDKCGGEWDTSTKECPMQVCLSMTLNYGNGYPRETRYQAAERYQVWCRPCLDASGVVPPREESKPIQGSYPTTEEVLVDLLDRLGFKRE